MTLVLGLTGSIGMGKSTVSRMFTRRGVPVFDADTAVHALYAPGGAGAEAIRALAPAALTPEGAVDRAALTALIRAEAGLLPKIEAVIHPLVRAARAEFLKAHADKPIVVLDIPLLFETKAEGEVDQVVVVSAPPDAQRARVLARPGMTEEKFEMIRARQTPDADKRARAHHVIETDKPLKNTSAAVGRLLKRLKKAQETPS